MFDIGWSEFLVIGVVALIAIGPKELPGVLRSAGQWIGKIKRMAAEFQDQFQEAMREAEMSDLKKHADDLNSISTSLNSGLDPYGIMKDVAAETKPTGATATDAAPPVQDAPPLDSPAAYDAPLPAPPEHAARVTDPIDTPPEAARETSIENSATPPALPAAEKHGT